MLDDDQLADILLDSDLIGRDELETAVEQNPSDESLYRTLVQGDLVDEGPLAQLLSELLNVEYVDVAEVTPADKVLDLLPRELAFEHETLPLELEREDGAVTLIVAMSDPIDMMAMDEVASHTGIDIRPVLSGPKSLRAAIDRCYPADEPDEEATADEPGGIEDVDPTARRPAPPPQESAQDDVNASVPGRPVTGSDEGGSQAFELEAIEEANEDESAGSSGDSEQTDENGDLPEQREPTRSELGRIAVERIAVSRDEVDEDGNLRPEALDADASKELEHSTDDKPESLTDPERRERLEELVENLDERSDTLLEDEAADADEPGGAEPGEVTGDHPEISDSPNGSFAEHLARSDDEIDRESAVEKLNSFSEDELLKAGILALVDQGVLSVSDLLAHAPQTEPSDEPSIPGPDEQQESGEPSRNTDQGTGPTFSSTSAGSGSQTSADADNNTQSHPHGLSEVSSEVG